MALLNWGNAFSQAGAAAASVGLEGVKATLEQDKIRLADELAATRESKGRQEAFDLGQKAADADVPRAVRREGLLNEPLAARARTAAQIVTDAERTRAQDKINIETSDANVDRRINALKKIGGAEAQVKLDAEIEAVIQKGDDPDFLKAARRLAEATHTLTPGQVAEGQLKQMELSRARTMDSMRGAYAAAVSSGDTTRANDIVKVISAYAFDPNKVKDAPELKAAQSILSDMSSSDAEKAKARDFIMKQLDNASGKIGEAGAGATPAGPPIGTVINGKEFTGGNPNDRNSWKPVGKAGAAPAARSSTAAPSTDLGSDSAINRLPEGTRKRIDISERMSRLEAALKTPNLPASEQQRFKAELDQLSSERDTLDMRSGYSG